MHMFTIYSHFLAVRTLVVAVVILLKVLLPILDQLVQTWDYVVVVCHS